MINILNLNVINRKNFFFFNLTRNSKIFKKIEFNQKKYFETKIKNKKLLQLNFLNKFKFRLLNTSFGTIDMSHILNDFTSFMFYHLNKKKYKNVLDIGANVGSHSIIFDKLGYNVLAFEPDPRHFDILKKNIKLNSLKKIIIKKIAISNKNCSRKFYQIKNNSTGNHIASSKPKPYGPSKIIKVKTVQALKYFNQVDFVKMDCEGSEDKIFESLVKLKQIPDILFEIHDYRKSKKIFNIGKKMKFNLFSQKNKWQKVTKLNQMPHNYKDGLCFATNDKKIYFLSKFNSL